MKELLKVNNKEWLSEVDAIEAYQKQFGSHLPEGIKAETAALRKRLQDAAH